MSQPIVRRPGNWKFTHAAAAMGAYWARARKLEARRRKTLPQVRERSLTGLDRPSSRFEAGDVHDVAERRSAG